MSGRPRHLAREGGRWSLVRESKDDPFRRIVRSVSSRPMPSSSSRAAAGAAVAANIELWLQRETEEDFPLKRVSGWPRRVLDD
jgi:hypothetical protein